MPISQTKLHAFEYLLAKLIDWHREATGNDDNDLSILKVLKLTFFVSAVGTTKNSENTLLEVFNNYVAMPYGHVESDIYNAYGDNELQNVSIDNNNATVINPDIVNTYTGEIKILIDKAIEMLKKIDFQFITLTSFELVDLSHTWYSWQYSFKLARSNGNNSHPISPDVIKGEEKIFQF